MSVTADKVQLTAKCTALSNVGELFQDRIFKFVEAAILLQFDCELGFFSRQRGQDQMQTIDLSSPHCELVTDIKSVVMT